MSITTRKIHVFDTALAAAAAKKICERNHEVWRDFAISRKHAYTSTYGNKIKKWHNP